MIAYSSRCCAGAWHPHVQVYVPPHLHLQKDALNPVDVADFGLQQARCAPAPLLPSMRSSPVVAFNAQTRPCHCSDVESSWACRTQASAVVLKLIRLGTSQGMLHEARIATQFRQRSSPRVPLSGKVETSETHADTAKPSLHRVCRHSPRWHGFQPLLSATYTIENANLGLSRTVLLGPSQQCGTDLAHPVSPRGQSQGNFRTRPSTSTRAPLASRRAAKALRTLASAPAGRVRPLRGPKAVPFSSKSQAELKVATVGARFLCRSHTL